MAQILYHGYSPAFTFAAASTSLPLFAFTNIDANCGCQLKKYRIGLGGTGNASVTLQIATTNVAATAAGTSTAGTIVQDLGRVITNTGSFNVCNYNYTGARTTETYNVVDTYQVANNVTIIYEYPGGDEPDQGIGVATFGSGFFVFFSAGTTVSTTVDMWLSRI